MYYPVYSYYFSSTHHGILILVVIIFCVYTYKYNLYNIYVINIYYIYNKYVICDIFKLFKNNFSVSFYIEWYVRNFSKYFLDQERPKNKLF